MTIINPTTLSGQNGITFYYPEDGRESLIKSYCLNGGNWTNFTPGDTFTLNKGDFVYLSGYLTDTTDMTGTPSQSVGTTSKIFVKNITSTSKKLIVKGNVASLFYGSGGASESRNDAYFLHMYVWNNQKYKNPKYIGSTTSSISHGTSANGTNYTIKLKKVGATNYINYHPTNGEVVYNESNRKYYLHAYYEWQYTAESRWVVYDFPNNLTLESLFGFDGTACQLEVGKDAEVFFPPSFN